MSPLTLLPGTRLGPFEILADLGAGGMGEVYRARDSKLNRDVAIKVLLPAIANDPDRLARFSREAQVLASLNHPNIAAIYGLEDADGIRALVMELVEGPTLADRIAQGPIALDDALPIAKQIAEALEAAHEQGIIHRDLKPANIKVRPDRTVKLLDFGLAKAMEPVGSSSGNAMNAPTISLHATQAGIILGTAAYMSPEQVRSQVVDKRTDIWAFGCVLYEMLTGRLAFGGGTPSDSLANTLKREPDWSTLPANVGASIRTLLTRCLAKNPANRLHDIADARLEIADAQSASGSSKDASPPNRGYRVAGIVAALGLAGAVASGWLIGVLTGRSASTATVRVVEIPLTLPDNIVPFSGIAASPDGNRVAIGTFGAGPEIWLRSLDSTDIRPLPGSKGGTWPFWSPDGRTLGFFADGKLKKADVSSGSITPLCDADAPWGGSWNEDGIIVFSSAARLYRVATSGGPSSPIAVADEDDDRAQRTFPVFLPDKRHFIYFAAGQHGRAEYVASLDNPAATRLVETEFPAAYAPSGHLLFVQGTSLVAQTLNTRSWALDGVPTSVARDVAPGFLGGAPAFSAARAGSLAYFVTRAGKTGQLTWFDRERQPVGSISQPAGVEYLNPVISPSGGQIAVNRMDPQTGNWDVWVVDAARDLASPVTVDRAEDTDPVWSPDGNELVFTSMRGGHAALFRTTVGNVSSEARLLDFAGDSRPASSDWTHDGRFIVYTLFTGLPTGHADIWVLPLTGERRPRQLFTSAQPGHFGTYGGHVSPDGRWIAYASDDGSPGQWQIYVQPFMAPGVRQQVSRGGGIHPRWTSGGREIVYWSIDRIVSVPFELKAGQILAGDTRVVLQTPMPALLDGRAAYDVTPDGRKVLVTQTVSATSPATVIMNWVERLKAPARSIAR